jgi:hypothetical protein
MKQYIVQNPRRKRTEQYYNIMPNTSGDKNYLCRVILCKSHAVTACHEPTKPPVTMAMILREVE